MAAETETRRIAVAEGEIAVSIAGRGQALVLLHGFGGDAGTWDGISPALTAQYRCIALDLRGFGASRHRGEERFSHVGDVAAVMDALAIDKAVIAGVSQGGTIAIDFALAHPGRVAGLVLISPGLSGWRWSDDWRGRWRELVTLAREGDLAGARVRWWAHPLFDSLRESAAGAAFAEGLERYSGREWVMDYQMAEAPAIERLGEIAVPVTLLRGGRDVADFAGIADHLAAHLRQCRVAARADLGHLLHLEDPEWVAGQLVPGQIIR